MGLVLPVHAIVQGQIDTFQSGSPMNWTGSSLGVTSGGGPTGGSDRYLRLNADGSIELSTKNFTQWTGNYLTAGVSHVSADLLNLGTFPLEIRALVWGDTPGGMFTSTQALLLPADGAWHHAVFGLGVSDLTWVGAKGGDLNATLGAVGYLQLRHQAGAPSDVGTPVASSLGIDNITAVPEPATIVMFFFGLLILRRG
jgi:hypothetical protein